MNEWILTGCRVWGTPEFSVGKEQNMARFRVGYWDGRKDGEKKLYEFFQMTAFGKTADLVEKHMYEKQIVNIKAGIRNNNWTDKDGNKRYDFYFTVKEIEFVTWDNKQDNRPARPAPEPAAPSGFAELLDDTLPF